MYMGDGISDLRSPYMNVSRPPWTGPDVISAGCRVFSWVFSWGDVFSAVSGVAGIDEILAAPRIPKVLDGFHALFLVRHQLG